MLYSLRYHRQNTYVNKIVCLPLIRVYSSEIHCISDNNNVLPDYINLNQTINIIIPTFTETTSVTFVNNWIVVQQRIDSTTNFSVPWVNYKAGFGTFNKNYWMGPRETLPDDQLSNMQIKNRGVERPQQMVVCGIQQFLPGWRECCLHDPCVRILGRFGVRSDEQREE